LVSAHNSGVEVLDIDDIDTDVFDEFLNWDLEFFHCCSFYELHAYGGSTFAGICQHHVFRNFHELAVTARYSLEVVLHDTLTAFAEILSECFFYALEQLLVANTALD